MTPTPEQEAIISHDLKKGDALKCIAFAGAGKTSTLVEYTKARPTEQFLYCAFNKSVQTEAEGKFPANVMSRTIHSLAYQSIGRQFQNLGNVPFFLVTKRFGVDVYRATLILRCLENWMNSADEYMEEKHCPPDTLGRFEKGFENKVCEAAWVLWDDMQKGDEKTPMTHSGYLKLYQLSKPDLSMFDTILLDEAQDTNPVTFDILRRQRGNGSKLILVGDPYQQIYCQPTGTQVLTVGQRYSKKQETIFAPIPIENLRVGQLVPCYDIASGYGCRTGKAITEINTRQYNGELISVYANNRLTRYTPEHHCVVRLHSFLSQSGFHVYLMRKGKNFRVGRTGPRLGQQQSCGISIRCTQENADAAWLLSVHPTKQDAAFAEESYAQAYNIPTSNFVAQANHLLKQDGLDRFWKDVGDNTYSAKMLLESLGRDIRFPLLQRHEYGANLLIRRPLVTAACNLMSGMEFMPDNLLDHDGKRIAHTEWEVGIVQREQYSGVVYSLSVADAHTYFADGLLTHNSWRGAQDAMEMIECPTKYITQSFRFGSAVASVANKLLTTFFSNNVQLRGSEVEDKLVDSHGDTDKMTLICRTNQQLFRSADFQANVGRNIAVVGGVGFENFMDKLMDVFHLYSGNRSAIKERQVAFFKSYGDLVKFAQDRLDAELGARVNIVNDFKDRTPEAIRRIRSKSVGEKLCDVLLVTGHKSKGLEWNNVSLADDFAELFDEHRQPFKVKDDMLPKDEVNLLYVAATRAQRNLKLNGELRSLMQWSPEKEEAVKPNSESDDMSDQTQCEESFLNERPQ